MGIQLLLHKTIKHFLREQRLLVAKGLADEDQGHYSLTTAGSIIFLIDAKRQLAVFKLFDAVYQGDYALASLNALRPASIKEISFESTGCILPS